ncbi:MAG: hypothetical protein ACLT3Y_03470 [Ruminococcus callidus]
MERFTQIAVASAIQALQDAGTDFKDMDPYRVGTSSAAASAALAESRKSMTSTVQRPGRISPFFVP